MSKKETVNNFLKHKRLIIISLLAIGLIVMIMLIYILTYANNKPKPFANDSKVKITNKCDYFDFTVEAVTIQLKDPNSNGGKIECRGKITNVKEKVSNVKMSVEVHTNWTTKTDVSAKDASFSTTTLTPSSSSEYLTSNTTLSLGVNYPYKVLPLVRVKKPTMYVKVTFNRTTPSSMRGGGETVTETVYYKIPYSQYYVDGFTTLK